MLYKMANQPRPPRVLSSSTSGCESKNGAASAIGTQPMIVIQPTSALCGCGGFHLRTSTVPNAHVTAAAKSPIAANGNVSARKVNGASSVTPIFRIGQLQPQTSVRTAIGATARASGWPAGAFASLIQPCSRGGKLSPYFD